MNDVLPILWMLILLQAFISLLQKWILPACRQMAIPAMGVERMSRVIMDDPPDEGPGPARE